MGVNVDNIVISKLVETKNNSHYWIGYLDQIIKPLVLILPKMSGYVKTFNDKGRDKDNNNKLMSLRIDAESEEDWRLKQHWVKCFTYLWW